MTPAMLTSASSLSRALPRQVMKLIEAIEELKKKVDIPETIREVLQAGATTEAEFIARVDT